MTFQMGLDKMEIDGENGKKSNRHIVDLLHDTKLNMDEMIEAQDELKYLTWLAMRNGIKPKRKIIEIHYGFSIPVSLYENLIKEIAEEIFPRYRYEFAKMLPPHSKTPRNSYIPFTKKYPPEVICDCEPFLIEILPLSEVKEWKNKFWNY